MFDNHLKETDLTDFICENCSNLNGKSTKANFDKSQSIKNTYCIKDILQRTLYYKGTIEWKTRIALPSQYFIKPPQEIEDYQYTLVSVIMHNRNSMSSGNYYC